MLREKVVSVTRKGSTAWIRHLIPQDRIWRLVDAKDQVLGRIAVQIANLLRGKHKPYFLDNMNCGDPVVVINARHFVLLGRKAQDKLYIRHSGYPGGLKKVPITRMMAKRPEEPLRHAVYNMLPRNRLRKVWMANLHIFLDEQHPHQAQNPAPVGPAHINLRLKMGGPPTIDELSHWWTQNLVESPNVQVERVISNVRTERASIYSSRGLADLLQSSDSYASPPTSPALSAYIAAAERSLQQDAVLVPQSTA